MIEDGAPESLAAVAEQRVAEAGWRMLVCAAIGSAAALLYSEYAPLVWAVSLALIMHIDRLVHVRVARRAREHDRGASPALITWTFFVAAAFASFAPILWLTEPRHGDALAYVFLCVSAFSAATTLHRVRALLFAAMIPVLAAFVALTVIDLAGGYGRRILLDLSPLIGLVVALFVGMRIVRRLRDADIAEQRADAADERADALARELAEARTELVMRTAQEVRTPLAAIESASVSLRATSMDHGARLATEHLLDAIEQLKAVVGDLGDLDHVENRRVQIAPIATDVRALVRSTAAAFEAAAEHKGITLLVDISDHAPPRVLIDPVRVRQILSNLIANAVRFTTSGGVRVRLQVAQSDQPGHVRLGVAVADTGPGMTRAELATHMSERRPTGARSAFGLAMSARMARLLGAKLGAKSAPGQGSLFSLVIDAPMVHEHAVIPPAGPRILIVAPPSVQHEIGPMLAALDARWEGVDVGNPARSMLASRTFDVILADSAGNDFDAVDVIEILRAGGPNGGAAVIALADIEDEGMADLCMESGADGVVETPTTQAALVGEIRRVLGALAAGIAA